METRIHVGSRVWIRAGDDADWQYVDGWRGTVIGFYGEAGIFQGRNPDGVLVQLYVPVRMLELERLIVPAL